MTKLRITLIALLAALSLACFGAATAQAATLSDTEANNYTVWITRQDAVNRANQAAAGCGGYITREGTYFSYVTQRLSASYVYTQAIHYFAAQCSGGARQIRVIYAAGVFKNSNGAIGSFQGSPWGQVDIA